MTGAIERPPAPPATATATTLRQATLEDIAACVDVFYESGEELHARTGQPILPRNPGPLGKLFGHIIGTDPQRSWVAEAAGGDVVGFGLAHRRESVWFLAFLFVRSDHQAGGVGRRLLDACLGEDREPGAGEGDPTVLGTAIEAIQPVSAGLYASFGILPRVPLYVMTGDHVPERRLSPVHDLTATPFSELAAADHAALQAEVDRIDRETLGYAHPEDHRMWTSVDRIGHLFRDSGTGETVGYGYVSPSGRIAPVAVLDGRWLPEAIDHLMAAVAPPEKWVLFVPGPSAALAPLLRAGFRFDGPPAIYCATGGSPAFERYLVGTFALL